MFRDENVIGDEAVAGNGAAITEHYPPIAVIDPEDEKRYALGIMLDLSAYAGQYQIARDRELTKQDMLESLMRRLYALDWWDHPDSELLERGGV